MKRAWKPNKSLWILPLLLAVTLILLEVPKQYYQQHDQRLLEESFSSQYEMQTVRAMESFLKKREVFLEDMNDERSFTIGYTQRMDWSDVVKEELNYKIQSEIENLSEAVRKIMEMQCVKGWDAEGYTAQIICFADQKGEQYFWEIGRLNFTWRCSMMYLPAN